MENTRKRVYLLALLFTCFGLRVSAQSGHRILPWYESECVIFGGDFVYPIKDASDERWSPEKADIDNAENCIRSFLILYEKKRGLVEQGVNGCPIILDNWQVYYRQVIGYLNYDNQKVLYINYIYPSFLDFKPWTEEWVSVIGACSYQWTVKYNVDTGEVFDCDVGGLILKIEDE